MEKPNLFPAQEEIYLERLKYRLIPRLITCQCAFIYSNERTHHFISFLILAFYSACKFSLKSVSHSITGCIRPSTDDGRRVWQMGEWYLPTEPWSDWLTDPLLPEKLKFSQLLNARDGADGTDGPTMHFRIAPCKVIEIRQRTNAVGKGCDASCPLHRQSKDMGRRGWRMGE